MAGSREKVIGMVHKKDLIQGEKGIGMVGRNEARFGMKYQVGRMNRSEKEMEGDRK